MEIQDNWHIGLKIWQRGKEREGNNGHKHVSLENRTGTAREVSEEVTSGVGAWACKGGRRGFFL